MIYRFVVFPTGLRHVAGRLSRKRPASLSSFSIRIFDIRLTERESLMEIPSSASVSLPLFVKNKIETTDSKWVDVDSNYYSFSSLEEATMTTTTTTLSVQTVAYPCTRVPTLAAYTTRR